WPRSAATVRAKGRATNRWLSVPVRWLIVACRLLMKMLACSATDVPPSPLGQPARARDHGQARSDRVDHDGAGTATEALKRELIADAQALVADQHQRQPGRGLRETARELVPDQKPGQVVGQRARRSLAEQVQRSNPEQQV